MEKVSIYRNPLPILPCTDTSMYLRFHILTLPCNDAPIFQPNQNHTCFCPRVKTSFIIKPAVVCPLNILVYLCTNNPRSFSHLSLHKIHIVVQPIPWVLIPFYSHDFGPPNSDIIHQPIRGMD